MGIPQYINERKFTMKKSLLIKILALALACIFVLPMVIACGDDNGDDNGGEDNAPTQCEVFFDAGTGTLIEGSMQYYLDAGSRLATAMQTLPVAEQEGYYFDGWYPEGEVQGIADYTAPRLAISARIDSDVVYHAKWIQTPICDNGTYNHEYGAWNHTYQPATCTQDGLSARECTVCGYMITSTQTYATGHTYMTNYTNSTEVGQLKKTRKCATCGYDDEILFTNKITEYMNGTPVLTGDVYGPENIGCLYNNNWGETSGTTFASKGGATEVEFELKEGSYIDYIYFKGAGSVGYEIHVLYEGATDYAIAGMSSFGDVMGIFTLNGDTAVQKVKITHGSCMAGTNFWQEVAFVVEPEATPVQ